MKLIHRASFNGGAVCGAQGAVSCSGVLFTCPACRTADLQLSKARAMKQIQAVADARQNDH